MFSRRTVFLWWIVSIVTVVLSGCSDPYAGRMEVTGAVILQGQPLKDGSILFIPLEKQDTQGGTQIISGEYKIPPQNGLKPGKYLVRLTAGDGKTPAHEEQAAAPGGSTNIVSMDLIPEEWNTKSKHEVEVKAKSVNRFDFDIPKINTRKRK
jgi:hypothetical protein